MKNRERKPRVDQIYHFLVRKENWLILLFLALSMIQIWPTRYVPSLDGPQHLYNANVILQLLKGQELFQEFFKFNEVLVGYWSGHFFLSLFSAFLPAWLAEKFFLTAYVLAMFFSFRYLVRSLNPGQSVLLVSLIFPFIFHNYLVLGYYSFSIAAIFYFWAFGYWIRNRMHFSWKHILVLALLGLALFLSHALVFVFFAASFALYAGLITLQQGLDPEKEGRFWPLLLGRFWRLLLALLPALILCFLYYRAVMGINPTVKEATYYHMELVKFMLRIRQLVGFNHEQESPAYILLFALLLILALTALTGFTRRLKQGNSRWLQLMDERFAWLGVAALFLVAYFLMPDRISAGSLTHRFGLYFFLAVITFLAAQSYPRWMQLSGLLVLLVVMGASRLIHQKFIRNLDRDAREIHALSAYMEDGSTVFSFNASRNWIHYHFHLYVADEKELVHLQNPQCAGQFPVKWNKERIPEIHLGERRVRPTRSPKIWDQGHRVERPDYVTVFHPRQFRDSEDGKEFQPILDEHYELLRYSSRGRMLLYRLKEDPE